MIDYTLTRSKRKTVALYIRDGKAEVRAPLKMQKKDIDKSVVFKEKWIQDKLAQSTERAEQREKFTLAYGDTVTYRGKQYPITTKDGGRVGFDDERFYMPPNLTSEQIKTACVQIYRMLAKRDIPDKVLNFAKQMSVTPIAVKINGAKTRWGSCSGRKSMNFSWRLIMADDDVVDYVVVHELAHITEINHSSRFWAIVAGVLPDYKERQNRLKELQETLSVQDWEYDADKDELERMELQENKTPTYHYAHYKTILSPKNGMNLYHGCTHGCIYCDSRSACYQMKHDFEDIKQ